MNYQESIEYLLNFADFERLPRAGVVYDLARVESLLARIGNPHLGRTTVHVAGTKGKGSTCAMVAAVLAAAGLRTGFYSSPHLLSYTERIRVDNKNISEADWAALATSIAPAVAAENADASHGILTTFEILTAMAFLHFRNVNADAQVMEVGLGGRLDATNVVIPDVCVITSISYEHMEVLGTTLPEIAREKAGILKPGVPVAVAPQAPEALAVIERIAAEKNAPLTLVGREVTFTTGPADDAGQSFTVQGRLGTYSPRIPLLGAHQVENAAAAVATLEILREQGLPVTEKHIAEGLAGVSWQGRLQVLGKEPWVIADIAHNGDSMRRLGEALAAGFPHEKTTLVIGFGNDKDTDRIIDEAVRFADRVVIVASRHPRALPPEKIAAAFTRRGIEPAVTANVPAAMKLALEASSPADLVVAAGSIFVIAEVLEERGDRPAGPKHARRDN
jgi:dihydrofolate synthase/folylpolyglutamate synthase